VVGLAGLAALGSDESLGVLLDLVGEVEQRLLPRRRVVRFSVGERLRRGRIRVVDVGFVRNRRGGYLSSVVGSTSGMVAPLTESTPSPPMKFWTRVSLVILSPGAGF
jgi:hypothetical protein